MKMRAWTTLVSMGRFARGRVTPLSLRLNLKKKLTLSVFLFWWEQRKPPPSVEKLVHALSY